MDIRFVYSFKTQDGRHAATIILRGGDGFFLENSDIIFAVMDHEYDLITDKKIWEIRDTHRIPF